MTCVFCEIVAGRAPASIAYEDEDILAFLDLFPILTGHLLVIPKSHYRNVFDAPPALVARVTEVGAWLAPALRRVTGCEGISFYIANEAPAGQEIWHLHLHLFPRRVGDGFGFRRPPGSGQRAERPLLDDLAARLREAHSSEQR